LEEEEAQEEEEQALDKLVFLADTCKCGAAETCLASVVKHVVIVIEVVVV